MAGVTLKFYGLRSCPSVLWLQMRCDEKLLISVAMPFVSQWTVALKPGATINPSSLQLFLVNQEIGLGLGSGTLSQLQYYDIEVDGPLTSGVVLYTVGCSGARLASA